MQKTIVTTTINPPTKALLRYIKMKEWNVVVVGDKKTPHKEYQQIQKQYQNVYYLGVQEQEKKYPKLSDVIGWNCIQRRSLGYIEAYKNGADIVATVDDDNIPYDDWGANVAVGSSVLVDYFIAKAAAFDPLSVTNYKHLWHRGYPLELLKEKNLVEYAGKTKRHVHVQADLWDGDPDIDAIGRFTYRPIVKFDITSAYCANKISPFNSQNTFISREALPKFYLYPAIGRMDDIWGAYVLQFHFPNSVIYNKASVYQERNVQSTVKNMQDELLGYEHSLHFIADKTKYEQYLPERAKQFMKLYDREFR
jgi:hypothetical protein